jgi:RNA polymerase primary sigma factor
MSEELGREVSYEELSTFLMVPTSQIKQLVDKGDMAKKRLVGANMRLVLHIAKYYRYRGIAYPDLVQEGTFGLMKAIDKYDPERGFRFSTYASWWIKQAISRAVAEKSRIVRLPVHIHDLMVSLAKAEKTFMVMNGRKPTTSELAQRLALPIQKIELLVKSKREVNSIDEDAYSGSSKNGGSSGNNEVQVKDRIVSDVLEPSSTNENVYLRTELRRSMKSLSEREAQILEMRFGLDDGNSKTLEEIGKIFNVTRERVRQIEARALAKLRHPEMANEFKEIFQDHSLVVQPQIEIDSNSLLDNRVNEEQMQSMTFEYSSTV